MSLQAIAPVNRINLINTPAAAIAAHPTKTKASTYGFVSTQNVVERLASHGWEVSALRFGDCRNPANEGFQKHLLRFQHAEFSNLLGNGSKLELVMLNSHDGKSKLRLLSGVFRIACLNGNILGDIGENLSVSHSQRLIETLDVRVEEFAERIPMVAERMRNLMAYDFKPGQRIEFERAAAAFALRNIKGAEARDARTVSRVRRMADVNTDAFTVTNRIQETLIRGGLHYTKPELVGNPDLNLRIQGTTRPVNSITEVVKRNQFVWDYAEKLIKSA